MLKLLNGLFEPEYFLYLTLFTMAPFVSEQNNAGTRNKLKHEIHKKFNKSKIYYHKIDIADYDNNRELDIMIKIKPIFISPTYSWQIFMQLKAWSPVLLGELSEEQRIEQVINTQFNIVQL